jgi:RNA polymerase sigma-54 factor
MGTSIGPRLNLRQTQTLALTPELRQAIRILQMPTVELIQHLEQELELNPLLERAEPPAGAADGAVPASEAPAPREDGAFEPWGGAGEDEPERGRDVPSRGLTLREHLATQIATDFTKPSDRAIALALLESLDEAGYLAGDIADLAARLGAPEERLLALLPRLQQLDPPGVFARSLAECLGAQLLDRGLMDETMEHLLSGLDLLAGSDFAGLAARVGVDGPALKRLLASLRRLDPKPGLAFDPATPETLVPDLVMQPRPGGGWSVEINPLTLPKLIVNRRYHAELVRTARGTEAASYVSERLASAKWLVRALDQRARTILKVATEIVRRQDGFFVNGVERLKPLVLREIAAAVKLHESTVSRATSNKFMATPRGTFELRYFFATALPTGEGDSIATAAVKQRIRELIDEEDPRSTLSDDRLVELLRARGVEIARRTVAKYRESLRIPSSVERRRRKAFAQ